MTVNRYPAISCWQQPKKQAVMGDIIIDAT
jgi:hypothetical protein